MNRNSDNHHFSRPAQPDDVHGTGFLYDPAYRRSHAQFRAQNRPAPTTLPLPHDVGPQLMPVPRTGAFIEGAVISGDGRGYARPSATTRLLFAAGGAYVASRVYHAIKDRRR